MNFKKMLVLVGALVAVTAFIAACGAPGPVGPAGPEGPAGPAGPAGEVPSMADLTCTECHNDTAIITRHKSNWQTSVHGSGAGLESAGERAACAGCHDGAAFSEMIAAGQNFSQIESGNAAPTHQDCRTCHQIHVTYTGEDWALETDAPVALVTSGATFDGGAGNLCAQCHQARRYLSSFVDANDATKYAVSTRFNTHYSVQVDVLMGLGDFGVEGKPGAHYNLVENTCVGCHMGDSQVHTFEPQISACQSCHEGAEDFNVGDYLTDFDAKYAELEAALLAKGLIQANDDGTFSTVAKNADGSPVLLDAGPAQALFFYNLVHEDGSHGIHNPNYFNDLMDMALAALE
jgi:hypothetical protein